MTFSVSSTSLLRGVHDSTLLGDTSVNGLKQLPIFAACGLAASASLAQPCGIVWTLATGPGPQPRSDYGIAYDAARSRVVLFGGRVNAADNNTWEWNGAAGTWSLRANTGPINFGFYPPLLAYDSARQRSVMVMYAGGGAQTWEWDGAAWSQHVTGTPPPWSPSWVMGYDASRQRIVLFPNLFSPGSLPLIWEFDGTTWTGQTDQLPAGLPAGDAMAAAFDTDRNAFVLIGRTTTDHHLGGTIVSTWDRVGSQWTRREQGTFFPYAAQSGLCYDGARHMLVYLEDIAFPLPTSKIWDWNQSLGRWVVRATVPTKRQKRPIVFDAAAGRAMLFGGMSYPNVLDGTTRLYNGSVSEGPTITEYGSRYERRSPGQSIVLTVGAVGTGPLTYRWRQNGSLLSDGGPLSGTETPELTINPISINQTGEYDAIVQDSCGSNVRTGTVLIVECYPNCDGTVLVPMLNANDFTCFLDGFAAGCEPGPPEACYVNCDHSTTPPILNVNDLICFMNRFAARCP